MIFPNITVDAVVQINDKFRIDATSSFASKDEAAISLVRIKPSADDSFITVTGTSSSDWYLDWEYSTAGDKTITVEVTTDGSATTKTATVSALTAASDHLFSTDSDIIPIKNDVLNYLPEGRNSFKYMHRQAQTHIIEWLDREGYVDVYNNKFTKADIVDIEEVKHWSKYVALRMIFDDLSNAEDDVFFQWARQFEKYEMRSRNRAVLRIDVNADGTVDNYEFIYTSGRLVRS